MIKNQSNLYQFVLRDMIGQGMTGLTPTVQIRKDSGSFATTTNTPTEVGYGAYEVILTATECNCDVMMFMVTLPDGQFPAILTNEYLTTTGGATPAEIWGYTGGRMVDNIPTVDEIWGREAGDTTSRTITNTIPSASDNAQAVWGASTKEVTIATAQAETFATASTVANIATVAGAIKAKTDNLPQSPAAVGDAMTLTSAYDAAKTASQFDPANTAVTIDSASVQAVQSGLSTFDPSTTAVTIDSEQLATLATAQAQTATTAAINLLAASILHWAATASTLTLYDNNGTAIANYALTRDSSGNITAIAPEEEGN